MDRNSRITSRLPLKQSGIFLAFALLVGGCALILPAIPDDQPDSEPKWGEDELRLEVSLSARELYVFVDGDIVEEYAVAVGQPTHPTPTGTWEIYQIDWNPDWNPPGSPWAEDFDYKPPGHPANPMGRVRMIFNPPYTVHGTDVYESLGRAASHGSIRMGNEDIVELAEQVMIYGESPRPETWVEAVLDRPTEMRTVYLDEPVRIDVIP